MQPQNQDGGGGGGPNALGGSFRSSFPPLSPNRLSFTQHSVVGTLDAENPFSALGSSFNMNASSFRALPPPEQASAELYRTVPLAASASQLPPSPLGSTLLDTATGIASPLGTMTGPAAAPVMAGSAVLPASRILAGSAVLAAPPQEAATAPLGSAPAVPGSGMVTFGSVPGVVVPPTAPRFASLPVVPQAAAAPQLVLQSLPAVLAPAAVGSRYAVGSQVEYQSEMTGAWIVAVVQGFNEKTGEYVLDVEPRAAPHRLRPLSVLVPAPTPPSSSFVTISAVPQELPPVAASASLSAVPVASISGTTASYAATPPVSSPQVTTVIQPTMMQGVEGVSSPFASTAMIAGPAQSFSAASVPAMSASIGAAAAAAPFPSATMVVEGAQQPLSSTRISSFVGNAPAASAASFPSATIGIGSAPAASVASIPSFTIGVGSAPAASAAAFPSATVLAPSTANPFASAGSIAGPSQCFSSSAAFATTAAIGAAAEPAVAPVMVPPPVQTQTMLSAPVVSSARMLSGPAGSSASLAGGMAPAAGEVRPQVVGGSYVAQGDPYMEPPDDVCFTVGAPAVRVEPHWRDGRWWYTTAVDFKGLDRYPLGSKQEVLVMADEALLELEEDGSIPPLPQPTAWNETDTCPIT